MPHVLAALSGGVDSSVAAALSVDRHGPDAVAGVTLLLWGGEKHASSCSTSDADAAAAAADTLGMHLEVLDRTAAFDAVVVEGFVADRAAGRTPNPCLTCNRVFKLDELVAWADAHGYARIVTGHYARVVDTVDGAILTIAADVDKDQSYVLWEATPAQLARYEFPLGDLSKQEVRRIAAERGLPAATAEESMDLCFDPVGVVADRGQLRAVPVVGPAGPTGTELAVQAVTIGQRRGIGSGGGGERLYVTGISPTQVTIGRRADLLRGTVELDGVRVHAPTLLRDAVALRARTSAHGALLDCAVETSLTGAVIRWFEPQRRVAPGQAVVVYDQDGHLVAGGYAT